MRIVGDGIEMGLLLLNHGYLDINRCENGCIQMFRNIENMLSIACGDV